jgi:hypothetical protein
MPSALHPSTEQAPLVTLARVFAYTHLDSDPMPVFTTTNEVRQLEPAPFENERQLQRFFEDNLEALLGVKFVATEVKTGERHGGRIDTLGLDEDMNPVIVEYKWDRSDSVINQGLYYLAWLVDHHGDFELAAQRQLGSDIEVLWGNPRLVLVASSYTKYDSYAVSQFGANVQLLRYQRYNDGTFVLETLGDTLDTRPSKTARPRRTVVPGDEPAYDMDYHKAKTSDTVWSAFTQLREHLITLEGVDERANQKSQITYRATKSFAAVSFQKTNAICQFKGGDAVDDPSGKAYDIRSRAWGYPWAINLTGPEDVDDVARLFRAAYAYEQ